MITAAPSVELRNASQHLEAHRTLADMLVIIGSAGDTGSNRRVDLYLGIIRELARKHGLRPLKLGCYYFGSPSKGCARRSRTARCAVAEGEGAVDRAWYTSPADCGSGRRPKRDR